MGRYYIRPWGVLLNVGGRWVVHIQWVVGDLWLFMNVEWFGRGFRWYWAKRKY